MSFEDAEYRRIAAETGIPVEVVEAVVRSQFRFLSEVIRSNTFEGVRFRKLGVFRVRKRRMESLEARYRIEFDPVQWENAV